jgi:TP901 family phage tail tape measure protein
LADPQGAMLGNAHGYVDIDVSGVGRNLDLAKQQFGNFIQSTGSMMQSWGNQIAGFGQNLTLWTAPVALALGTGLNVAADFDSVLTEIQARTGLTAEAMEQVRQTALQLGADTAFSSQQAADAFLNLLTAGLSVEDALSTLPQVLTAAAAGGMDLGRAADLTTSIMSSFNLSAQDTTAIIDAMSKAAGASPASMNEIGIAMQDVGGLAQMYNLSLDQTAAILAIFARNGIRGAEAGTQLRSMLRNLSDPTAVTQAAWDALGTSLYNADGSMRNLDDVLVDVRAGLENLPVQQQNEIINQLAGSYGMAGFNALLASEGIAAMEASMDSQSNAATVAQARMNSFAGVMESLKGSVETFWITVITPFMDNALRPLAVQVTDIVNRVTAWAAANEPLVQTMMTMLTGLLALGPTLFAVGKGVQLLGFFLTVIANPFAWLAAAVGGLAYLFRNQLLGVLRLAQSAVGFFFGLLRDGVPVLEALQIAIGATFGAVDWQMVGTNMLNGLSAGVATLGTWVNDNLITPLVGAFSTIDWGMVGSTILQGIGTAISLYSGWINFVTDNILTPLFDNAKNGLITINWQQLGEDIIGFIFSPFSASGNAGGVDWGGVFGGWMDAIVNFGTSVFDFMGWAFQNVIFPLWQGYRDGLAQVDWGAIGTTLMNLLGTALNVLWTGATWAWDNLIKPMIDAAGLALQQIDWGQLGLDILNLLGQGLLALWGAATWAYDNLIMPLFDNAKLAIESIDWFSVGESIVNSIGFALQTTFDFIAWIIDNIFNPLITNADGATGIIDWSSVGDSIMTAIASALVAFLDFALWVKETIIDPMIDGAATAIGNTDWSSIGQGLMDAIKNALPNIAQWVQDWIIGPITRALSGFDPMVGINTSTQLGGGGYQAQVQSTVSNAAAGVMGQIGGFASGINYVPNDMIALIHQGERIQRANENPYNPNAQSAGMGNISFEGANFNFPNVRSREDAIAAGEGLAEGIMKKMRNTGVEEMV